MRPSELFVIADELAAAAAALDHAADEAGVVEHRGVGRGLIEAASALRRIRGVVLRTVSAERVAAAAREEALRD
jgi:hypothetical protein